MTDNELLDAIRQIILAALDLVERKRGVSPTTAEIRKLWKRGAAT